MIARVGHGWTAWEDVERAVFFPDDGRFLVERVTRAVHYEVAKPL